MGCSNIIPPKREDFIGCDGKPLSDKFLTFLMNKAVDDENYEMANKFKIELERRKAKTNTP